MPKNNLPYERLSRSGRYRVECNLRGVLNHRNQLAAGNNELVENVPENEHIDNNQQ